MQKLNAGDISRAVFGQLTGNPQIVCGSVSINSKKVNPGDLFIAIKGQNFDGHNYINEAYERGANAVISQSAAHVKKDKALILVDDTKVALGRLAKWYKSRLCITAIGVTGSVGKTSTKEFIYSVLNQKFNCFKTKGNLNNDIGLPLSLLSMDESHECAIIEMGMNHFGELSYLSDILRPDIGVITNIGVAHIENFGSRENILKAKLELLHGMNKNTTLILNGDEELLYEQKDILKNDFNIIYYGIKNTKCAIIAYDISTFGDTTAFKIKGDISANVEIPAVGTHNVYNALCAAAAGAALSLNEENIKAGLLNFINAKKRQNIFTENDITFIDDTYNSNPDSMTAALEVLRGLKNTGKKIVVMGDMLELGSYSKRAHEQIGEEIAAMGIDLLFLKGKDVEFTKQAAKSRVEAYLFDDDISLFNKLKSLVKANDAVLFKGSRGMEMENILKLWKVGDYK